MNWLLFIVYSFGFVLTINKNEIYSIWQHKQGFQTFIYCEVQTAFHFLKISMIRTLQCRVYIPKYSGDWFFSDVSLCKCKNCIFHSLTYEVKYFISSLNKSIVWMLWRKTIRKTPRQKGKRKDWKMKWRNDEMKWKLHGFLFTVECKFILFKWKSFSDTTTCQWLQHVKKRNKTMNS